MTDDSSEIISGIKGNMVGTCKALLGGGDFIVSCCDDLFETCFLPFQNKLLIQQFFSNNYLDR